MRYAITVLALFALSLPASAQSLAERIAAVESGNAALVASMAQVQTDVAAMKADISAMSAKLDTILNSGRVTATPPSPGPLLFPSVASACGPNGCAVPAASGVTYYNSAGGCASGSCGTSSMMSGDAGGSGGSGRCGPIRRLLGRCR